ncbi:MAG: hypothetical protein ACREE9_19250 [Stellaceae bacterium]
MRKLLFGLAVLPFLAGVAAAAQPLTDAQMDKVTAGAVPSCAGASMCNGMSTTQSSTTFTMTNSNGVVTTTTTNSGPITMTLGGETSGTGGSTGGTTGTTTGTAAPVFPLTITAPEHSVIVTAPIGFPGV